MRGSVAFDRAAEYYDRTRTMSPQARAATRRLLTGELAGRGRVVEVGVGTGQIALALHESGIAMVGVDISGPMIGKLVEKAAGHAPFPLALADGAALPFPDRAFGGGIMRHVLHLVPAYRDVIDEVLRVVRPGGVVLTSAGWHSPVSDELESVFSERLGRARRHVGLDPHDVDALDAAFGERGATPRGVDAVVAPGSETLAGLLAAIGENVYSWTWRLSDEERAAAAADVRRWAESRGAAPDDVLEPTLESRWRAYDVPAAP
jgi:SAM-dependent methyltransferase